MAGTFTIRIEATNLRVARKEYESLGKYLENMEAEYGAPKEEKAKVAVKDTEPKATKKATPKPKPAPKAKEEVKPKQEVVEEVKKAEEAPTTDITHADIVSLAREAVKATGDRPKVDKVIKRYGHPISKITENNFEALVSELKKLIG